MMYECVGDYAKKPYYIEEICMNLYSMEELCYYLHENAFLLDRGIMKRELCDFIERDLGMVELGRKLAGLLRANGSLCAFVSMILEAADYCSREELKRIESGLRDSETMGQLQRRKVRGDYLLNNGKYTLAAIEYKQALEQEKEAEANVKASVLHNLGVAYARMFLFDLAAESYMQAYELNKDEDSYEQYLASLRLGNNRNDYLDMVLNKGLNQEKVTQLEEKLRVLAEESRNTSDYLEYSKALEQKEHGEVAAYYDSLGKILLNWKKEYKKNMIHD